MRDYPVEFHACFHCHWNVKRSKVKHYLKIVYEQINTPVQLPLMVLNFYTLSWTVTHKCRFLEEHKDSIVTNVKQLKNSISPQKERSCGLLFFLKWKVLLFLIWLIFDALSRIPIMHFSDRLVKLNERKREKKDKDKQTVKNKKW